MNTWKEINLEEGMPTVDEAMGYLKGALAMCRQEKYKCLTIIHGYGSTGKGGAIGEKVQKWLMAQKKQGAFKNVIFGGEFTIFNFEALALKNKYRELEAYIGGNNHGVTIVEL